MKATIVAFAFYVVALLVPGTRALAQTGIEPPQELFQTESVYPQERGSLQLVFGSQFDKSDGRSLLQTPLSIEYGLTQKWQISFEWAANKRLTTNGESVTGPGDAQVGTKYSWMNIRRKNFHVASGFDLGLPTGSVGNGLEEGELEYEPYVVVAKDSPQLSRLQLFSQFGMTISQPIRSTDPEETTVSKGIELNNGFFVNYRRTWLTGELNWHKGSGENELYLTPGIVWPLPRNLEIGIGAPIGLTRDASNFRAIIKLTYEFGGVDKPN